MDLSIRDLAPEDNISEIVTLCKENNLLSANYATSESAWNFQYRNNPIKKSWNAVIHDEDSNLIMGHVGLIPLPVFSFPNRYLAGSISNGVVSPLARNRLVPFNKYKTFPIISLINRCCENAFRSNVDFIFAFSSIHQMIWKALKFTNIEFSVRMTLHSTTTELFKAYKQNIWAGPSGIIVKVFKSIFLCSTLMLHKLGSVRCFIKYAANKRGISISNADGFDGEFCEVISTFNKDNTDIITYDRQIVFLNWRFSNRQFIKVKIYKNDTIIGYAVLEKNDAEENREMCTMVDFVVLNEYIMEIPHILYLIRSKNRISFKFQHYLSCDYSQEIYNECKKSGHAFGYSAFRERNSNVKRHVPFYFRVNPYSQSNLGKDLKEKKWFITPICFAARFHRRD